MFNIRLTIAYDGTSYLGWQKTKMGPSIEQTLESILKKILQEEITLQAASRTDAGVHAIGQVANFICNKPNLCLYHPLVKNSRSDFARHSQIEALRSERGNPSSNGKGDEEDRFGKAAASQNENFLLEGGIKQLQLSLNSLLPKDISILDLEIADINFHPTLECTSKEYHYHLCYNQTQLPHSRNFSWHFPRSLDIPAMQAAAELLIGEKDFQAFCNFKKNSSYDNYIRQVHSINIVELPDQCLRIEIRGNNFLYKMVRNLVGTLAYVGCGKISLASLPEIIENKKRPEAGMTAPAHGLFLFKINYS